MKLRDMLPLTSIKKNAAEPESRENRVDFHTHSTFSDGSLTPEQLVALAIESGLRALALTDHDTIDGIPAALRAAETGRLLVIPGVELSADYRHELHVLGYFRPDRYTKIAPFLEAMRDERAVRNLRVIEKLNGLGIPITAADVADLAGNEIFGRPHIAATLVKRGYARTIEAAFSEYLAGGRRAYVPKNSPAPEECIAAIADAGGLAVIAHPIQIGIRLKELRALAASLIPHGLSGLEVYYPEHRPQDIKNFAALADELGLIATGGSDFHGEYRKKVRLGTGKEGNLLVPDTLPDTILRAFRD